MACPFLEMGYKECRKNLTLRNLDRALGMCGNEYTECRIYHELFHKKLSQARTIPGRLTRRARYRKTA